VQVVQADLVCRQCFARIRGKTIVTDRTDKVDVCALTCGSNGLIGAFAAGI
jgi:hypothetical protein